MQKIKFFVAIVFIFCVVTLPKRTHSQETILWQAFAHAGWSFQQGITQSAAAMELYAAEIFSGNPELTRMLHQYSGPIATFIEEQVRRNPQLRTAIAENVYRMLNYVNSPAGKRAGLSMAREMGNPSNWRHVRAGSAGVGPIMVVAVGVTSLIVSHQIGQRWLESFQRLGTAAEADAQASLIGLMISQIHSGKAKLCGKRTMADAKRQLIYRMKLHPNQPLKGIICKTGTETALSTHPCTKKPAKNDIYYRRSAMGGGWIYWQSGTLFCDTYYYEYAKISGGHLHLYKCKTKQYKNCREYAKYKINQEQSEGIHKLRGPRLSWTQCYPALQNVQPCR